MRLTAEQEQAIHSGKTVQVSVGGAECILLRKDVFERGEALDFSPWTVEEIDLLAAEAADLESVERFSQSSFWKNITLSLRFREIKSESRIGPQKKRIGTKERRI